MSIANKHAYRFEFLSSEKWGTIRAEVLAHECGLCFICYVEDVSNDVHHMFYRKRWTDTRVEDCHVLCRRCHDLVHEFMSHEELKGLNAHDLQAAFKVIAVAIRKRLRLQGIPACRPKKEEIKPLPVMPPGKRKGDFLREEIEKQTKIRDLLLEGKGIAIPEDHEGLVMAKQKNPITVKPASEMRRQLAILRAEITVIHSILGTPPKPRRRRDDNFDGLHI